MYFFESAHWMGTNINYCWAGKARNNLPNERASSPISYKTVCGGLARAYQQQKSIIVGVVNTE